MADAVTQTREHFWREFTTIFSFAVTLYNCFLHYPNPIITAQAGTFSCVSLKIPACAGMMRR